MCIASICPPPLKHSYRKLRSKEECHCSFLFSKFESVQIVKPKLPGWNSFSFCPFCHFSEAEGAIQIKEKTFAQVRGEICWRYPGGATLCGEGRLIGSTTHTHEDRRTAIYKVALLKRRDLSEPTKKSIIEMELSLKNKASSTPLYEVEHSVQKGYDTKESNNLTMHRRGD